MEDSDLDEKIIAMNKYSKKIICINDDDEDDYCNIYEIPKQFIKLMISDGKFEYQNFKEILTKQYQEKNIIYIRPNIYDLSENTKESCVLMRHSERADNIFSEKNDEKNDQTNINNFWFENLSKDESLNNTNLSYQELCSFNFIKASIKNMKKNNIKITTIYSSPFRRCLQTAIIFKRLSGIKNNIRVLPILSELKSRINKNNPDLSILSKMNRKEYYDKISINGIKEVFDFYDFHEMDKITKKTDINNVDNIYDINKYLDKDNNSIIFQKNIMNLKNNLIKNSLYITHGDYISQFFSPNKTLYNSDFACYAEIDITKNDFTTLFNIDEFKLFLE